MNRTIAQQIADDAQSLLDAGGIDTKATTNSLDAPAALNADQAVVVVNPPIITFETWTETACEWQVWLIAGPERTTDPDKGWDTLARAIVLLAEPLEVTRAEPTEFTDGQGHAWPAYTLTVTSDHLKEI